MGDKDRLEKLASVAPPADPRADRTPRNLPPHPRGIRARGMRDAYPGA